MFTPSCYHIHPLLPCYTPLAIMLLIPYYHVTRSVLPCYKTLVTMLHTPSCYTSLATMLHAPCYRVIHPFLPCYTSLATMLHVSCYHVTFPWLPCYTKLRSYLGLKYELKTCGTGFHLRFIINLN